MGNLTSRVKRKASRDRRRFKSAGAIIKNGSLDLGPGMALDHAKSRSDSLTNHVVGDGTYDSDAELLDFREMLLTTTPALSQSLSSGLDDTPNKLGAEPSKNDQQLSSIDGFLCMSPEDQLYPEQNEKSSPLPNFGPTDLPSISRPIKSIEWQLPSQAAIEGFDTFRNSSPGLASPSNQIATLVSSKGESKNELSAADIDFETLQQPASGHRLLSGIPQNLYPMQPGKNISGARHENTTSESSIHLHSMRISHHLRSNSALSVAPSRTSYSRAVNDGFPGLIQPKQRPRAHRQTSSSGFHSAKVPLGWGRVISDEASSIYSSAPTTTFQSPASSIYNESRWMDIPAVANFETVEKHDFVTLAGNVTGMVQSPAATLQDRLAAAPIIQGTNSIFDAQGNTSGVGMDLNFDPQVPPGLRFGAGRHGRLSKFQENIEVQRVKPQKSFNRLSFIKAFLSRERSNPIVRDNVHLDRYDGANDTQAKHSKSMNALRTHHQGLARTGNILDVGQENPSTSYQEGGLRIALGHTAGEPIRDITNIPDGQPRSASTQIDRRLSKSMYQLRSLDRNTEAQAASPLPDAAMPLDGCGRYSSPKECKKYEGVEGDAVVMPKPRQEIFVWNADSASEASAQGSRKESRMKRLSSGMSKTRSMHFGKTAMQNYVRLFRSQSTEFESTSTRRASHVLEDIVDSSEQTIPPMDFLEIADLAECVQSRPNDGMQTFRNLNGTMGSANARAWSQMYQSCIAAPVDPAKSFDSESLRPVPGIQISSAIDDPSGKAHGRNESLASRQSMRDSTMDFAKLLQETEARERARAMQLVDG